MQKDKKKTTPEENEQFFQAVENQSKKCKILAEFIQKLKSECMLNNDTQRELLDYGYSDLIEMIQITLQPTLIEECEARLRIEQSYLTNLKK